MYITAELISSPLPTSVNFKSDSGGNEINSPRTLPFLFITHAKRVSFEKRILLAKIIRSFRRLGHGGEQIVPILVLEYLFGENELVVEHFQRYM